MALRLELLETRDTPDANGNVAVGTGPGVPAQAMLLETTGATVLKVAPFAGYAGGVRVASGDVTGDGVTDLVAAAGPGAPPHVKVFDGATGREVYSFYAFDPGFTGGLFVSAGDVTGDRRADIVVGSASGASHVKVFDAADRTERASFLAFAGFGGGVTVAAGDLDGDARADLIVGTASGASHVKAFDGATGALVQSFLAFGTFPGGVNVGYATNVTGTPGVATPGILTGVASGPPHVKAFRQGLEVQSFYAFDPRFTGGARVTGAFGAFLVGPGVGAVPATKLFVFTRTLAGTTALTEEVNRPVAFDSPSTGGVFVG